MCVLGCMRRVSGYPEWTHPRGQPVYSGLPKRPGELLLMGQLWGPQAPQGASLPVPPRVSRSRSSAGRVCSRRPISSPVAPYLVPCTSLPLGQNQDPLRPSPTAGRQTATPRSFRPDHRTLQKT